MDLRFVADELASNREAVIRLCSTVDNDVEAPARQERWTAAQHLKHLALFDDAYVRAMSAAEAEYREGSVSGSKVRGIGLISAVFLRITEPPVRRWARWKAPEVLKPAQLPLADALHDFLESHDRAVEFYVRNCTLDLDKIYFVNPFVRGLNFSLATCVRLIAAHERRHLWQIPRDAGR
jgi:hypothetical protein